MTRIRSLRSQETEARYRADIRDGILERGCKLCEKPALKQFAHWKIVINDYPYDSIAEVHDMIVSLRHVREDGLSSEELSEYKRIKEEHLMGTYQYILEATHGSQSIPSHYHLHLINARYVEV
jgi:hypothetical protein